MGLAISRMMTAVPTEGQFWVGGNTQKAAADQMDSGQAHRQAKALLGQPGDSA